MRHTAAAALAAWTITAPPALAGEPENQPNVREILERAADTAKSITRARFSVRTRVELDRDHQADTEVTTTITDCWVVRENGSTRFRVQERQRNYSVENEETTIRSAWDRISVGDTASVVHSLEQFRNQNTVGSPRPQRDETPYSLWRLAHPSPLKSALDPEAAFYGFPHDRVEYIGSEDVDGVRCHIIQATQTFAPTLYIGAEDFLLRRTKRSDVIRGATERTIESTLTLLDTDSEFSDALFNPETMELPPLPDLTEEESTE